MSNTFRVIDLSRLYDKLNKERAYLILGSGPDSEKEDKKIRMSPRRYLTVFYNRDKNIRIMLRNKDKYNVLEVPYKDGVYDLFSLLKENNIETAPLEQRIWKWVKYDVKYVEDWATIYNDATVIKKSGICNYILLLDRKVQFEDTDIYLRKVTCDVLRYDVQKSLFNKCIRGENVTAQDFDMLFDVLKGSVCVDFGSLRFDIKNKFVMISKVWGGSGKDEEKVVFKLKRKNMIELPMLLHYAILAEEENQLVSKLNKYLVH